MSSWLISLMFGIGVGTFVWTKLIHSTGNARPANSLAGAAVVGLIACLFLLSVLKLVLNF